MFCLPIHSHSVRIYKDLACDPLFPSAADCRAVKDEEKYFSSKAVELMVNSLRQQQEIQIWLLTRFGQEGRMKKTAISVEVYRKVREEGRWLCSPPGSRVLGSAGDVGKTHISTPPPLQGCSSYSDRKEQSLQCRDPPAHLEEHTDSHTGLAHDGHISILLLSHTPLQMTLLPWSRGPTNATHGKPKKGMVTGSS